MPRPAAPRPPWAPLLFVLATACAARPSLADEPPAAPAESAPGASAPAEPAAESPPAAESNPRGERRVAHTAPPKPGRKWALVVGVNYDKGDDAPAYDPNRLPVLRNAENDADDFADTLRDFYGYGDRLRLLKGEQATENGIRDGLRWLTEQAAEEDSIIVYLSGHGVKSADGQDGASFLASDYNLGGRGKGSRVGNLHLRRDLVARMRAMPGKHKLLVLGPLLQR